MKNMGELFKTARTRQANLSPKIVAKFIGISPELLLEYESGKIEFPDDMIINLFHASILMMGILELKSD